MTRQLIPLLGNSQQLDGGAMFGHVPKALWSQWITPDAQNRIPLACRALLVREANRNILLEAGIGAFFSPALRERYGINEEEHVLLNSLQQHGLSDQDIDVVILSHLHFDHAGGLLSAWDAQRNPTLLFPNAQYLVSKLAWERACHPHFRDRASFIPELNEQLAQSGRLLIVEGEQCELLGEGYRFLFSHGHTPGLMHTVITMPEGFPVIFCSDLIPATPWVHLPVTMGYDRFAEQVVDEKKQMLEFALEHNAYLFYTHDPEVAMSQVQQEGNGKFKVLSSIKS